MTTQASDLWDTVEHKEADSNGVKIHYVVSGPEDAPLVVMIHGFPDFWYSWRSQMTALHDAYRVVAVDNRGYNFSDQPEGVESYAMPLLVGDIHAVIATEGRDKAVIVGHDWGGAIAWNIAMYSPDVVSHLIILNLPHPKGLGRELANNSDQQTASQYAFDFQQERAHEQIHAEALTAWVRDEDARAKYLEAFKRSSIESMLNYYKANFPRPGESSGFAPAEMPNVKMPVLMFHGLEDTALLPGALSGTWEWVDNTLTLITIPGASHFVQQDAPEIVNHNMRFWLDSHLD